MMSNLEDITREIQSKDINMIRSELNNIYCNKNSLSNDTKLHQNLDVSDDELLVNRSIFQQSNKNKKDLAIKNSVYKDQSGTPKIFRFQNSNCNYNTNANANTNTNSRLFYTLN